MARHTIPFLIFLLLIHCCSVKQELSAQSSASTTFASSPSANSLAASTLAATTVNHQSTQKIASKSATIDFANDVVPVLTKLGCNAGACHGAAAGRGGLALSLYGSRAYSDFQALTMELAGRRINLNESDESLIYKKPVGLVEHGGGEVFSLDSEAASILLDWIDQGAHFQSRQSLERVEFTPRSIVLESVNHSVQLKSIARYSDGSTREVTDWTSFQAEDSSAVIIESESATATVLRSGRHIVIARYLDHVAPIEILVPYSDRPVKLKSNGSLIDRKINTRLSTLRLPVSDQIEDSEFIRRVTLDLTGRLPTMAELDQFIGSQSQSKREQAVDRLLASEAFTEYWTLQFAKLLRIRPQQNDSQGAYAYHRWLNQQVASDTSIKVLAHQLLLSNGDTHQVGPANFYRTGRNAQEQTEFFSELFMGSRLRCANCHDHPLDQWKQDDYHGLAAIFAKVSRGRVIQDKPFGEVIHPATLESARAQIPGHRRVSTGLNQKENEVSRQQLARWLTKENNPYLAKSIVNRLWKRMMGRGLVESTDDFRATNPATHPELLDQLARHFANNEYRIRSTLRLIVTSEAYSRSVISNSRNRNDRQFYSRALRKPMDAEVLADAISDVLGIPEKYLNEPLGKRAVTLINPETPSKTLDVLGRCDRSESCEGGLANPSDGLAQQLHLFNGKLINARISKKGSRLRRLLDEEKEPIEIIDEFYRVAYSRKMDASERTYWQKQLATSDNQMKFLEDFVWSILNSEEFRTNH